MFLLVRHTYMDMNNVVPHQDKSIDANNLADPLSFL
jgi:hypothetical protein